MWFGLSCCTGVLVYWCSAMSELNMKGETNALRCGEIYDDCKINIPYYIILLLQKEAVCEMNSPSLGTCEKVPLQ